MPAKKGASAQQISPDWPVWFSPASPLGSAVHYVATLSPRFNWVGIYVLKGKTLELGPFMGEATPHKRIAVGKGICGMAVASGEDQNVPDVSARPEYLACSLATRSELVVLIHDAQGKVVGQIDIDSHVPAAFGKEEEGAVRRVAQELGARWDKRWQLKPTTKRR